MVTAGVDHCKQARIDGRSFAAAGLEEGGIPLGQVGRAEIRIGGGDYG